MAKTELTKQIELALQKWNPNSYGGYRTDSFRKGIDALEVPVENGTITKHRNVNWKGFLTTTVNLHHQISSSGQEKLIVQRTQQHQISVKERVQTNFANTIKQTLITK